MIIMTEDQANQVRGHHTSGHALAPKPFKNDDSVPLERRGMFALPESTLVDPLFEEFWPLLSGFPTQPDSSINQGVYDMPSGTWIVEPDWETDPALLEPHSFSDDWTVGEVIVV